METNALTVTHAGMVVTNLCGQVLVISAFGDLDQIVFPKGHIEPGETSEQAAQREMLEECSIVATPLTRIGTTTFKQDTEDVVVEWWTGIGIRKVRYEFCEGYAEEDFRETRWVTPQQALELLSFEDLKDVLRKAICWS